MFSLFSKGKKKSYSEEELRILRYVKKLTGKKPNDPYYYVKALTHRSWSEIHQVPFNNERLEFLGDAILDTIVSDYLFTQFPDKKEGPLTEVRSRIVNRTTLNKLGMAIGLEKQLRAAVHRINEGTVLGNAVEALIGAIYLDMGYNTTQPVVLKLLQQHLNFDELLQQEGNHKSRLIEWSQRAQRKVQFQVEDRKELPEEERFKAQVLINESAYGTGMGRSKKIAEQRASRATFKLLKQEGEEL